MHRTKTSEPLVLLLLSIAALVASGIAPVERLTWWLEITPVLIAWPILVLTARRFPLTPLAYRALFLHAIVLIVGGYYTYAQVPLGFWVRDAFDLARNNYDRLGHFMQGAVPAILAREILLRKSPLQPGKMLFFLVVSVCVAISACYELIEWWVSATLHDGADSFLGMQGDIWDTQWDMFMALIGAITSQLLLSRLHTPQVVAMTHKKAVKR